jgi:uncharacterized protein (TIGR03083 family)
VTATCHARDSQSYCESVAVEIDRFASVVAGSDLQTKVETCPPWTLDDLIEHTGSVHRWAASMVRVLSPVRIPGASLDMGIPADRSALPEWLAAGAEILLPALRSAPPEEPMWAWGSDKHARFWPRRMLHETGVHRADAETALGIEPTFAADDAVDGIDEFLDNLPHAVYFAPKVAELRGAGETLLFRCPESAWQVRLGEDGFTWKHADAPASVTITGDAGALLLLFYGRGDPSVTVEGDPQVLAHWRDNSAL